MKKPILIYILLPAIFAFIAYLSSSNIIVTGIVFVISTLYFFLIFMREFNNYQIQSKRFKTCYQFINTFIISLSIKLTIPAALESTISSMDDNFKEELKGIQHLPYKDRLAYLKKALPFHIFELFLNVIDLYEERGGNILDMSTYLLEELRNQNEYFIKCESMAIRKMVEFAILWFLSLAILILLRFALSEFFGKVSQQLIYQGSIVAIFVLVLASIEILARKAFRLDLKGWNNKNV